MTMAALRSLLVSIAFGGSSLTPLAAAPPVLTGGSGRVTEAAYTDGMSLLAAAAGPVTFTVHTPGRPMFAVFSVVEFDVTEQRNVPGTFKLFVIPCGKDVASGDVELRRNGVYRIVTQTHTLQLTVAAFGPPRAVPRKNRKQHRVIGLHFSIWRELSS